MAARWRGPVDALKEFGAGLRRMAQYHGIPPDGETVAYVIRIIRDLEVEEPDERRCRAATVSPTAGRLRNRGSRVMMSPAENEPAAQARDNTKLGGREMQATRMRYGGSYFFGDHSFLKHQFAQGFPRAKRNRISRSREVLEA